MDSADHVAEHAAPGGGGWLTSRAWWVDAAERAARAAAGGALLVLGGHELDVVPAADWRLAAGAALTAGVISLLVSIAAGRSGDRSTAAFARRPPA